jgi:hypothetical protein
LFLLISGTAISGTFGVILMLSQNGLRDARLMEAEMMAREQAEQAEQARRAEMAARKALQEPERALGSRRSG